jgi:NAD(P)-dependent dehydrogenase (short-subunit alcohol dehydrogenase family)
MKRLEQKCAVVTGAGTGIGREIAMELAKQGASVMVHYNTSKAGAQETVQIIAKAGGRAAPIQANLEHVHECTRLIQGSVRALGGINILVNNAAVSTEARFLDVSEELWDRTLNTNLRAPFFCAQAAVREMIKRGGGKVINIGSVHGLLSVPVFGPYAAAKGGLHMLTRQMAIELAPYRINVNCVAPGLIEVKRYFSQFSDYDRDEAARDVPWGRVGFPRDIAPIVAFLCSDDAGFITGQVIYVDGGQSSVLASRRSPEAHPPKV